MRPSQAKRRAGCVLACFRLAAMAAGLVLAASIDARPAVLRARHFTTADGLARDSVHSILRDRISYLWFATGEGISRFDGYGFINYGVRDGLPDRDVRAIAEAEDGTFLVGTGTGAARFDPYRRRGDTLFAPILPAMDHKAQSVRAVLQSGAAVWMGTDAGLFLDRDNSMRPVPLDPGGEEPIVVALARTPDGNVWAGTSGGLFRIAADARPRRIITAPITAVSPDGDGLLAASAEGLFRLDENGSAVRLSGALTGRVVRSILRSRDGTLWVGTWTGVGQYIPSTRTFAWMSERQGLAVGNTQALAEGQNGDIWIGYDGAGAIRISANGFLTFGAEDGFPPLPSQRWLSMHMDAYWSPPSSAPESKRTARPVRRAKPWSPRQ